ncbi:discoidin domain-containing protein [Nocardia carnea]|uniref:discoidin domain-containing protein n=1 Tax=Nocardia carnea TaxID=37328 RepID=UPI00245697B1|nr:hypothetical protein [Nocardia carnea]
MPDADSGDVFLRNRGAILDALLADPAFGLTDEPAARAEEPVAVAAPPARASFDESLLGPAADPGPVAYSRSEPEPPSAEPDSEPVPVPPRRSTAGPSASERINALLSGQPMDPGATSSLATENAERAASRLNSPAATEDQPERPAESERAAAPRQTPQEMAREVAEQLRKPRVALAVAAVVALLIVVLLVVTGGEEESGSTPLAVTAAPTQAPPATEPPGSGTIMPKAAESSCPPGGTEGMDAFSGEPDKAWSCPRAYKLDGQVLRIDLGQEYEIDSIGIVPGWDHVGTDGADQWTEFRTVSRVSYQFEDEDRTTYTQETLDQRSLVVTRIEPPLKTSEIVLTVLRSAGSRSTNTVAISSIIITGR